MKRFIVLGLVVFVLLLPASAFCDSQAVSDKIVQTILSVVSSTDEIVQDAYYDSADHCYHIVTIFDGPLLFAQFANTIDFVKEEYASLHESLVGSYPTYKQFVERLGSSESVAVSYAQINAPANGRDYTIVMTVKDGSVTYDYAGIYASSSAPKSTSYSGTHSAKTFSPGEWECPRHLPAGAYSVTCTDIAAHVAVYRNGIAVYNEALIKENGDRIGRLVLKVGDTIMISGGDLCFTTLSE